MSREPPLTTRSCDDSDLDELEHLADLLWEKHAPDEEAKLAAVLADVPIERLRDRPRLLGAAILIGHSPQGEPLSPRRVVAALTRFHRHLASRFSTMPDARDALCAGIIAILTARNAGDLDEADELAEKLEQVLEQHALSRTGSFAPYGWLAVQRAVTAMLQGRFTRALGFTQAAYDAAQPTTHPQLSGRNGAALAALLASFAGSRRLTLTWLHRHDAFDPASGRLSFLVDAPALLAQAVLGLDSLDEDVAGEQLAAFDDNGYELWPFAAMVRSRFDQIFGSAGEGMARLDETMFANAAAPDAQLLAGGLLLRARADLLLEAGEGSAVIAMATARPDAPMLRIPAARAYLRAGMLTDAARLVAMPGLSRGTTRRDAQDLLLIDASIQLRRGDLDDAVRLFRKALGYFTFTGNLSSFREVEAADRRALCEAAGIDDPLASRPQLSAPRWASAPRLVPLTPRELAAIHSLTTGATIEQIAQQLSVSTNTIKSQLRGAYRKLGVSSRADAVLIAARHGLLGRSPGPSRHEGGDPSAPER